MPATVTLSTTTLDASVDGSERLVRLGSTSGVMPGTRLYIDGELMRVLRLAVDPWVEVIRGVDGSKALPHSSTSTVYIGTADQFYETNPRGQPGEVILVSPYINIRNGTVWFAQGDVLPSGKVVRWWLQQVFTYDQGPLGVRTAVPNVTAST